MSRLYPSAAEIGAIVRRERRRQGLRQAELAALTGCGPRFIGELERGKETLHLGKVLAVLRGLGLSVEIAAPPVGSP